MIKRKPITIILVGALTLAGNLVAQTYFFWTNTTSSVWSDVNSWSNAPSAGGETNVILNFIAPATYTSENDFPGGFILNGLNATDGTVTLTGGDLIFTNRATGITATDPFLVNSSGNLLVISNNITANNVFRMYTTNDVALYGNLTTLTELIKAGPGTLTLAGVTAIGGDFSIHGGNYVDINGNLLVASNFVLSAVAGIAGRTAVVNQTSGTVIISGALYVGNTANLRNQYNLFGGDLVVTGNLVTTYSGIRSLGIFNMTNGTLTVVGNLNLGRAGNIHATTNYFIQSGGTATVLGTLNIAANNAAASNQVAHLIISNGVFTAASFGALAARSNQQCYIYFGPGANVTLPAFPTARGVDSYSQITFDGGTLTPAAASANYISNLNRAYLTTNGAIFNTPVGRDITVPQNLEDAPGHNGKLTKTGEAVLTLTGSNTYSGGTFVNAGILNTRNTFALPNYNAAGGVTVASNAALSVRIGGLDEWTESQVEDMMTNATFAAGALLGLDTTSGDFTLTRNLDGPIGYAKLGANTLTLTGTNIYTGPTWIYGGTLSVETIGDNGTNSGIGWGNRLRFAGGTLQLTGAGDFTTGRDIESLGAATLDITNANASLTLNGNWGVPSGAGNFGFTKTGAGKLALNGTVGLTGATVLNDGTTTIGGAVIISNTLTVAGTAGARAFLEIQPGALLHISTNAVLANTYQMYLGNAADAVGVIRQTGGTFFNQRRAEQAISLGAAAGGYGAYELFSGVATAGHVSVGQSGTGYLGVYGGTFVPLTYLFASRTTGTGIVDIAGGTIDASSLGNLLVVGTWNQTPSSALGVMNVRDGGTLLLNKVFLIGRGTNALGIVNILGGGTAVVNGVSASGNLDSQAYLNFNGGLLQARTGATTIWMSNELDGAFIFNGGAFLDDNGQALTIAQPLSAPTGKGVSSIAINDGGTNYLAPPAVIISGGSGVAATAIAQLDYTTGAITNILITSPGSGYQDGDVLTVTLIGGGGTGASLGSPALTDNVSGGLTKLGTGILTLAATNTYTGGTVIQAGALVAVHTNALPLFDQPGNVTVASNAAIVVRVGGAGEWDTASIDALLNNANLNSGAAFGFDTTSGDYTSDHLLSGNIGLLKLGANTLTITNANTYTGPTVLQAGTLSVSAIADAGSSSIGHGSQLVFQGGTLRLTATGIHTTARGVVNLATATIDLINTNATLTLDGSISGSGGIIKEGPGTLILTASNSFSGAVGLSNGILNVRNSFALGSGSVVLGSTNAALQLQDNVTIANPLTLRGNGFNYTDGALRNLSGSNTYAGNITLAASSRIQADSGTLTLTGSIARDTSNRGLDFYVLSNAHIIVTGTIGALGTGNVEKYLPGALTFTGTNTFTGQLNINQGTLIITSIANSNMPSAAGAGGSIRLGNAGTSGALVYIGSGDSTDRQILIGDNTAGTARTGAGAIQNDGSGPLVFTNPSFNTTNRNTSTAPLRILTLSGSNTDANEIQGIIADNGANTKIGLRKEGTGHWILSGQNTYTGPTLINAGTLTVNGAILNSFVTNNVGGTLAGTGFVANLTIEAGALSPGNSVGTLTVGDLTLNNPTLYFELDTPGASDLVIVNNILTFSNMETNWFVFSALSGFGLGTYTLFQSATLNGTLGAGTNFTNIAGSGYDGYLFVEGNDIKLEVIPEPGSAALVAAGLLLMLLLRRRR